MSHYDGRYRSSHYFVFQILPNLILAYAEADRAFWYCTLMQYSPVTHDRTDFRGWSFNAPFEADHSWLASAARPITDPIRHRFFHHYFKQVVNEDAPVCERMQEVAHQIDGTPLLSAQEVRIGWFEESLRELELEATSARQQ